MYLKEDEECLVFLKNKFLETDLSSYSSLMTTMFIVSDDFVSLRSAVSEFKDKTTLQAQLSATVRFLSLVDSDEDRDIFEGMVQKTARCISDELTISDPVLELLAMGIYYYSAQEAAPVVFS